MFNNIETIPKNKKLILFDGVCNLCNQVVIKIIKKDKKNIFLFALLQSDIGKKITKELGIDISLLDSIILYNHEDGYYIKSNAALRILKEFSGFWKLIQLAQIFPNCFNDFFYDYVARNRYKWFGKEEKCMIPSQELNSKFLL